MDNPLTEDFARKALEYFRRKVGHASEQVSSRRLTKRLLETEPSIDLVGRRILVLSMRDWSVHVQLEALLAQALKMYGADISLLGCGGGLEICDRANTWEGPPMPCRSCTKYVHDSLKAHGLPSTDLSVDFGQSDWPELDELDLEGLRRVTYRDLPVGEIVDLPVKWFLTSEALDRDPLGVRTYRAFLRSARRVTDAAITALDEIQPDHVVMVNGLFLMESIVSELAKQRGIRVTTYERAFVPGTFLFSEGESAGFLRMDDVWDDWSVVPLTEQEEIELDRYLEDRRIGRRTGEDLWRRVDRVEVSPRKTGRRVVLFTNLVWDVAVVDQNVAFASIVDWIVAAIGEFRNRPEDELIIRIHPAESKLSGRESRERIMDRVVPLSEPLPANVRVIPAESDISSYDLMEIADFGLAYSSTTGLEMVLAGKPVIVAARTHYREKGFTIDVSSPAEFATEIDRLCSDPTIQMPDLDLARRYAHLFFFKAPYSDLGISEPVRGLVTLSAKESHDLRTPGFERLITAIAGSGDYLPRPARSSSDKGGIWSTSEGSRSS